MKIYNFLIVSSLLIGCAQPKPQPDQVSNQIQSTVLFRDAIIYQLNVRQFSPEGSFKAVIKHFPRLKELGVSVLMLMPVHPVGLKNRQGSLGDVHSVKDHYKVNSEFGSSEDFGAFVTAAHENGLKVMLDWEVGATSWDHDLILEHPDWYLKDTQGNFVVEKIDELDKVMLNTQLTDVGNYMQKSMKYWIEHYQVDGFRIHHADLFDHNFWKSTKKILNEDQIEILAGESTNDSIAGMFDFVERTDLLDQEESVFKGVSDANAIRNLILKGQPNDMSFTSEDHINAYEGSVFERLGKSAEMNLVMGYIVRGCPMIYAGQEVGLNRSLSRTEKDAIEWGDHPFNALYARLGKMKKTNHSMWNDAPLEILVTNHPNEIIAIHKSKDDYQTLAFFNYSNVPVSFQILPVGITGKFKSFKSRSGIELNAADTFSLPPWGYELFTANPAP